ncbi:MAG TPA: DUF4138 domain-containing protein [Pedobacter sp.]|nr:DUF4138 domain-containing protein [Pedobacter sp.]
MKFRIFSLLTLCMTVCSFLTAFGQRLPVILLPELATLHFLSPEPIQYVDISSKTIAGDLPLKNVLRIKRVTDSISKGELFAEALSSDVVVTITGETFMAQYRIAYSPAQPGREFVTQVEVLPQDMKPLQLNAGILSQGQLEKLATTLFFKKNESGIASAKAFDIYGNVNHLATFGNYLFLDLSFTNRSNLNYDTDQVRFKIEDEKRNKASTVQSIELKPEFVLFNHVNFRRNYRNVFVFKRFSYPGHKVFRIEMNEKQISGRVIGLKLKYKELLEADTL